MVSLPEAIRRKYGEDTEDFEKTYGQLRGVGATAKMNSTSGTSPIEIFVPLRFTSVPRPSSVLILNNCDISVAGNDDELKEVCKGMEEMDLSDNKLTSWQEVSRILCHSNKLTFLNLSFNKLGLYLEENASLPHLPCLSKLVLINAGLDWPSVHRLVRSFAPESLTELHLSMNELDHVLVEEIPEYRSVQSLYLTKNPLTQPEHFTDIGLLFPRLKALVMADCPLTGLGDVELLRQRFKYLERLNIDNSALGTWEELEKVRVMESLVDLRIMGCRGFEDYTAHERRQQMVARLDNIKRLNGSVITKSEREDAERAFVRLHLSKEPHELPRRYHELVAIHGELNPLIDVDLSPRTEVTISIEFDGTKTHRTVSVYMTVFELKQVLEKTFGIPPARQRLFYVDQDMVSAYGPEEMRFGQKKLYSYNVQPGDEFVLKTKN